MSAEGLGAFGGGFDGADERSTDAGGLQLSQAHDGGAGRAGHTVFQQRRVRQAAVTRPLQHLRVPTQPPSTQHRFRRFVENFQFILLTWSAQTQGVCSHINGAYNSLQPTTDQILATPCTNG